MQADQYLGISTLYTSEYKASGSKFYGFLFPAANVQDFEYKIKEYKAEYADATHVCNACVIGLKREYQRCTDDGEPSNSSGRPILNAMLSAEITNVGCAVVRYYGGKKLGIPGLIEAYGGAAIACLDGAEFSLQTIMNTLECTIDPATSYLLYNYLAKTNEVKYNTDTNGKFILNFPQSLTEVLREDLKKITTLTFIEK